jgi:FkbM family methyltransferase
MGYTKSIYSAYAKPVTERLGVHGKLRDLYWKIKIARHPVEQKTVGDTTVQFNITNRAEYVRHRDLGGEGPIIEDLLSELKSDDVVYDIGANVGTYTCFLSERLQPNQVVALEPHPSNLASLRSNLELNNTDAIVIERALSDTNGTAELKVASQDKGEGKHSLAIDSDKETITVELAAGDQLIESGEIPAPTVLKIDVEGAEYQVLQGLEQTLQSDPCRLIYVEVHPEPLSDYDSSMKEIEILLESVKYDVTTLQNQNRSESFVKAIKHQPDTDS